MIMLFWSLTLVGCALAIMLLLLPVWHRGLNTAALSSKLLFSLGAAMTLTCCAYALYFKLGAAKHLSMFYSVEQLQQDRVNTRLRPLYARLQRELLKAQQEFAVDPANVQLIVNFANIHAQMNDGVLPHQVEELLLSVLRSNPNHAGALNLLAGHYNQSKEYDKSAIYLEKILLLIPDKNEYAKQIQLLRDKLAMTQTIGKNSDQ